jgi:hypothetical protein
VCRSESQKLKVSISPKCLFTGKFDIQVLHPDIVPQKSRLGTRYVCTPVYWLKKKIGVSYYTSLPTGRYQSKTKCENKNVSYEAHLCTIIVKAQRAPNAQATLQIVNRHYEEFLSPAALTLKLLRRPSNRSSPRQHFIRLCSHMIHVVYRRTWYVCRVEKKQITDISPGRTCRI